MVRDMWREGETLSFIYVYGYKLYNYLLKPDLKRTRNDRILMFLKLELNLSLGDYFIQIYGRFFI